MSYGARLKEIKKELKLTTEQMSASMDIPARTFGSYERNESKIPVDFLTKLCKIYNVNANWFCLEQGKMFAEDRNDIILSSEEQEMMDNLLKNPAGLNMILKFLEIKRGNKEAVDELMQNLQGIKAYLA